MMLRELKRATIGVGALLLGAVGPAAAQDVTYAVTTTNISVGHASQSSIPQAMGYWKDEGLNVDVLGLSGATAGIQQVAAKQVDFATVGPEALLMAQAEGLPVKAVYTFARLPIYRIVSLKDGGPTSAEELAGKVVGVPNMSTGSVPFARAVLKGAGIDPETGVEWLAVGLGAQAANALKGGDVDVWASWDTAVASLENGGFEFNFIEPEWMDEMFGNVMIAHVDTIAEHPDWVAKVARGIAKSSVFGLANPEATIRNHWKMYPQTAPAEQSDEELAKAKHIFDSRFELLLPKEGEQWGENMPVQWKRAVDLAAAENLIPADTDPSAAYTNEFIDEINDFDPAAVEEDAKNSDW